MNIHKRFIGSLILISTLAQAEESTLNKAKGAHFKLWDKQKKPH